MGNPLWSLMGTEVYMRQIKARPRMAPKSLTPTHSFDEWVCRLEGKTLVFLTDQRKISGMNGKTYDDAIVFLINKKMSEGEKLPSPPPRKRALEEEDDGDFIVEHVSSGPKGATIRVKTPRSVYTS